MTLAHVVAARNTRTATAEINNTPLHFLINTYPLLSGFFLYLCRRLKVISMGTILIILILIFIGLIIKVAIDSFDKASKDKATIKDLPKQDPIVATVDNDGKYWLELRDNLIKQHSHERSVTFYVVGGIYRSQAAQEEYTLIREGYDISLRIEPENTHDKYAVKVISDRKHIGYVEREDSKRVFQVVAQKCVSMCIVIDNHYAYTSIDPDLMEVQLFIKPQFADKWRVGGYYDADEPVETSK